MSRKSRKWLLIAIACIFTGALIFTVALTILDFDFTRLSTQKYDTYIEIIDEDFNNISIDVSEAEIVFKESADGKTRVECFEEEKVSHDVAVEDGTLKIDVVDSKKWYEHIGIFFAGAKIIIYLPKSEYDDTSIKTDIGDIEIRNIDLGEVEISTSTGEIELENISCNNINAKSSTGDINLESVIAKEKFNIKSETGSVEFENSDASEIIVKTSTGDVEGTLLSEKIFNAKTSTGEISIPKSATGGKCEIRTDTGDIEIEIS